MLSEKAREALKAKAYVQDILAGLVPSDPEFGEIWNLIPDHIAGKMDHAHAPLVDEFVSLASKVRAVRERHAAKRADKREG